MGRSEEASLRITGLSPDLAHLSLDSGDRKETDAHIIGVFWRLPSCPYPFPLKPCVPGRGDASFGALLPAGASPAGALPGAGLGPDTVY